MLIIFIIFIIFYFFKSKGNVYLKSYDNIYYKVQNGINKYKSLYILTKLRRNCYYLLTNIDKSNLIYDKYRSRFDDITKNINNLVIDEKSILDNDTSYTIDKKKIILCLKSKKNDNYHDINNLKYILIHELAHVICPENGHTDLFYSINIFLLKEAVRLGIYKKKNYKINPIEYCGIKLNEYLL